MNIESKGSPERADFLDYVTSQWLGSPQIQAEFGSFLAFEAYARHHTLGHVRTVRAMPRAEEPTGQDADPLARWNASSGLRMEFGGNREAYLAYARAMARRAG